MPALARWGVRPRFVINAMLAACRAVCCTVQVVSQMGHAFCVQLTVRQATASCCHTPDNMDLRLGACASGCERGAPRPRNRAAPAALPDHSSGRRCDEVAVEEDVRARSASADAMGAKSLCIPLQQPELTPGTPCFASGRPAKNWALWGRSY